MVPFVDDDARVTQKRFAAMLSSGSYDDRSREYGEKSEFMLRYSEALRFDE